MEWKKAKNYIIIFLIIINCVFFVFNVIKRSQTRLGAEEIQAVSQVLRQRGITLNCELPEDYSAMGQLYMRPYEYDNIVLQEIFFGKIDGIRRTEGNGDIIFTGDGASLTVSSDSVHFEGSISQSADSKETASLAVESYVRELNLKFTDYRPRISVETDDGYFFEYSQSFHSKAVFSNYLRARVYKDGKIDIVFNYQQPLEYKGVKEQIISADEAVYAASSAILNDYTQTTIDGVEKGYYLTERHGSGELAAVPQYKIYVDGGESAYYVNAYSGDVIRD